MVRLTTLSFDSSIYSEGALEQACKDYRDLADIHIRETEDRFICDFSGLRGDAQLIMDEFGNYALNLTIMMAGIRE